MTKSHLQASGFFYIFIVMKLKKKDGRKKSTRKASGKKAIKNSKSRSNKNIRKPDSKGQGKSKRDAKSTKIFKAVQNTGRKSVNIATVSFGKKQLTENQAKRLTKDQLVRLVRKNFTGVTRDFTKADLIFNLYGKAHKEVKRRGKKKRVESNLRLVEIAEYEKHFIIYLKEETYERKAEQISGYDFTGIVESYRNKQKLLPRAYMIILVTSNGNDEFDRANKMSAPDVSVIAANIKRDILQTMRDYDDVYNSLSDDDSESNYVNPSSSWVFNPNNIISIIVRFFYAG